MPTSKARVRKLALALEGASEVVHVDRPAFRTSRKIFATLPPDTPTVNLMFDLETQELFRQAAPGIIEPLPGGWGRMGMSSCDLRRASEALVRTALEASHELARPKPKGRSRGRTTAKRAEKSRAKGNR